LGALVSQEMVHLCAMRSKREPMKKFVRTLMAHEDLLMNYFKARKAYSSGIVEKLNFRVGQCMRKTYRHRSFELLQVSLFHTLGDLHEPVFTHTFFGKTSNRL
jgi:hypothetical protein